MPRLQGYRERLWWKYYDTLDLAAEPQNVKFFSNKNVGDYMRTNLMSQFQLSHDQTFVALGFYANCPIDDRCSRILLDFVIGSKPMLPKLRLKDWLLGFRPARPLIIPVRQSFWVASERWELGLFEPGETFETSVHLEGLDTRDVQ